MKTERQRIRLRLTYAGYRIDEIVTPEGQYITWPGLYEKNTGALSDIFLKLGLSNEELEQIAKNIVRQEDQDES